MRFIAVLSSPFSTFRRHRSPISGFAENVINFCRTFVFPSCFLAWCINVDGLVSLDSRVGDPLLPYFYSLNWIAWDFVFIPRVMFPFFPCFCLLRERNYILEDHPVFCVYKGVLRSGFSTCCSISRTLVWILCYWNPAVFTWYTFVSCFQ